MSFSLQVLYPTANGTTFDHDYYLSKHMDIVHEHMGQHVERSVVTKGLAGGPNVPAGYHAIATFVFADQAALDAGMAASGPAVKDIPNFYSGEPQVLVGEVTG